MVGISVNKYFASLHRDVTTLSSPQQKNIENERNKIEY
jgi:hypothetical protein